MNTKGQYECHHSLFIRDPLLNEIYRVLYDELKSRSPNHERTTLAQLQTMMLRLQRRIAHDTPQVANTTWSTPSMNRPIAGQSRNIELLTKLHEYIHIHLREPLPLKRLSAQAGLSPTHLNRLFRAHHGTSAVHYVIQVRMDAARTIIAESPNLAIKEIMHLVGYSDQAHFSHAFSKAHGLPPRTFRNQCLKITALADRV